MCVSLAVNDLNMIFTPRRDLTLIPVTGAGRDLTLIPVIVAGKDLTLIPVTGIPFAYWF